MDVKHCQMALLSCESNEVLLRMYWCSELKSLRACVSTDYAALSNTVESFILLCSLVLECLHSGGLCTTSYSSSWHGGSRLMTADI